MACIGHDTESVFDFNKYYSARRAAGNEASDGRAGREVRGRQNVIVGFARERQRLQNVMRAGLNTR